jgi:xanthine dehydrogenase iron-sulfur cluster and FAD-binding subunit A
MAIRPLACAGRPLPVYADAAREDKDVARVKAPTVWEVTAQRIEAQRLAWRGGRPAPKKKKKQKGSAIHGPNLRCDQSTVRSGRTAIVTKPTTELDFSL